MFIYLSNLVYIYCVIFLFFNIHTYIYLYCKLYKIWKLFATIGCISDITNLPPLKMFRTQKKLKKILMKTFQN